MQLSWIDFVEVLIPLGIAFLLLSRPQWFTKGDINSEESQATISKLQMLGWLAVGAALLILIAILGSAWMGA
jgi:hypothetical protein